MVKEWRNVMKIFLPSMFLVAMLVGCSHSDNTKKPVNHPSKDVKNHSHNQNKNDHPKTPEASFTVQEIFSLASTGRAVDIPFKAHLATISQVKKAWGNPDQVDQVGNGFYATYTKKSAVFGYNKEGLIFDIRSNELAIKSFHLSDIEKVMGNPTSTSFYQDDKIYTYKLNSEYQLKWIIPDSTGKVDHISVYSTNEESDTAENYILPIKGTSVNLTKSAWENMLRWREAILAYPKSYPNDVFVNGPNKKMVALTFDDGPDRINTPKIINELKQQNVKGTFFFIGQKVKQNPDIVKLAYENGNVIGSHSFYHHELTKETAEEIRDDLIKSSDTIRTIIGRSPALFRPPFGDTNNMVINVAKEQQYKMIIWSIDTLDWSQKEQSHIQKNVFDNVRNGDIILMHSDDDKTETAKAVPEIIKELKHRGFEIVDVATLLNTDPYK